MHVQLARVAISLAFVLVAQVTPFPTQTPTPVNSALTGPFAYGVASGDMTSTSAILWTRTPETGDITPELSTNPDFGAPTELTAVRSSESNDFTLKVTATQLSPGTDYYYRFRSADAVSDVGTFRTAYGADQDAAVTLGFTGDAHWAWKPYPLLASLVKEPLDTFVFLGDLIYESRNLETGKNGTIAAESLDDFRWKYRENREPRPGGASDMVPMRDLYEHFGQYSVFDNHETGFSKQKGAPPYITGGAQVDGQFVNQTEGFRNRIQAYSEYQPVEDAVVQATGDPRLDGTRQFYRTVSWGANVELFILDDRSYRDAALANATDPAAADCSRTMLGAPQLSWFENQLTSAQSHGVTWKVVVISSPIQELGKDFDGTKAWPAGYVCERNRLLKFIDDKGINNVVFLTTDNHYTVINNLSYNTDPGDPSSALMPARNAIEILTGPLGADTDAIDQTHNVDVYGLSLRDADRKVVDTWNGTLPDAKGKLNGLVQQGFDPIGLEASFPGLVASSVVSDGMPAGEIVAADFASFRSFGYAVLRFDHSSLSVRVMGIPAVMDPIQLYDPVMEKSYEQEE
ncbi:MAG: alkaline phosphatase D family protein, partial [Chloroflexi bacterium]|nr:alkaline phosphatase D family protein [Chloroflexota bacterium]